MEAKDIIQELKNQMKAYLDSQITKEVYAQIAEEYVTEYGDLIEETPFYEEFMSIIPDLCLTCVDEPWDEDLKSKEFQERMEAAYRILGTY